MSRSIRRSAVALVAVAAVAAGVPALVAGPAAAGPSTLVLTGPGSVSAYTCAVFTVTIRDEFGGDRPSPLPATSTIKVELKENPASDEQDIDFCVVPGTTSPQAATTQAEYKNGPTLDPPAPGGTGKYTPGTTITDPDSPQTATATPTPDGSNGSANLDGVDTTNYKGAPNPLRFGVVGLMPSATPQITVTYDDSDSATTNPTTTRGLRISAGGPPGSAEAANNVSSLTLTPAESFSSLGDSTTAAAPAQFTVTARNDVGDTVSGVTPLFAVQSGPNAPASAGGTPTATFSCSPAQTSNAGSTACSYQGQKAGVDKVLVFINQTKNSPTLGPDSTEPQAVETVTTTPAPVDASQARYVDLQPPSATIQAGRSATFTVVVTSLDGRPAKGVAVSFSESGPGTLRGGTTTTAGSSAVGGSTDNTGRAVTFLDTTATDSGSGTVSVAITSPSSTSCQSTTPSTAAPGNCADTSTTSVTGGASPSATPTATMSSSPTPSTSTTPSSSASSSTSPTSSATPACGAARVVVNTRTINATGLGSVTVTGVRPNSSVELQGYSQNHQGSMNFVNDPTPIDRTGVSNSSGAITFNDLRPASNTRLRARQVLCTFGNSDVIEVRAQETLAVKRISVRQYTFSGNSIPAREGGLIISLYRIVGAACSPGVEPRRCPGEVFVGQNRASATTGRYAITTTFPVRDASVRDEFVVKTGRDAQNAPGRSNARSLLIF